MTLIQHEAIPHARKLDWMNRLFRTVDYKMIPRIVILNHAVYNEFCEKYNINQDRVLVNKLGPLNVISVFAKGSDDINSSTIVFWGRIARYKGLEYLCQAMPLVHEAVPEVELIIAGSGDFYFDINPYLNLSYIKFIHKFLDMEELADIIEKSAFTVCPYVSSSQSGGVIASLAMGKPVIGTNFETMREMIDENVTGLLVPPRNHIELANAIIKLLKDKDLRNKLKENIKNSNKADIEWRDIAKKYLSFYRKKYD
jgi:glycosyltransferase involved in cell wall biosynthesis